MQLLGVTRSSKYNNITTDESVLAATGADTSSSGMRSICAQRLTRTLIHWAEGLGEDGPAFLSEQQKKFMRGSNSHVSTCSKSRKHRVPVRLVACLPSAISQQDSAGLAFCFAEHGAAGLPLTMQRNEST